MTADFELASDLGVVGLWDASMPPPVVPKVSDCVELLRRQAKDGALFFIQQDDPVKYRIRLCVGEEPPESIFAEYENVSGSFKLALPTGALVVSGVELEGSASSSSSPLSVAAGDYVLTLFSRRDFDGKRHRAAMEQIVGAADYRHNWVIDRVGAAGCLTTLLAILLIIIPATRRHWWITLALLTPWLTHLLLTQLPRYKRTQKRMNEFTQGDPHNIIALKRSPAATELAGGWIRPA